MIIPKYNNKIIKVNGKILRFGTVSPGPDPEPEPTPEGWIRSVYNMPFSATYPELFDGMPEIWDYDYTKHGAWVWGNQLVCWGVSGEKQLKIKKWSCGENPTEWKYEPNNIYNKSVDTFWFPEIANDGNKCTDPDITVNNNLKAFGDYNTLTLVIESYNMNIGDEFSFGIFDKDGNQLNNGPVSFTINGVSNE